LHDQHLILCLLPGPDCLLGILENIGTTKSRCHTYPLEEEEEEEEEERLYLLSKIEQAPYIPTRHLIKRISRDK
jgi:hypothetical protein